MRLAQFLAISAVSSEKPQYSCRRRKVTKRTIEALYNRNDLYDQPPVSSYYYLVREIFVSFLYVNKSLWREEEKNLTKGEKFVHEEWRNFIKKVIIDLARCRSKNNFVERSSWLLDCQNFFSIAHHARISYIIIWPTKLFSELYLSKFLNTWAKSFCVHTRCDSEQAL